MKPARQPRKPELGKPELGKPELGKPKLGKPRDGGAALVLVLWGAVVMSIIAAAAARQASMSAIVVNASAEMTRARALADAGIRTGWAAFADGEIDDFGAVWGCRDGADLMLVRLRPESARIDINMASEGLLTALYRTAGASQQAAESLAAATLEYRYFGEGAEDSGEQVGEGTSRIPEGTFRRGPFQTIEELGYLPGMDATLFRAIADDVSVHGRAVDIDVEHASPLVRQAFEAAAREDAGSVTQEAASTTDVSSFEASLLNVRSIAVTGSGAVFVRDSVVEGPFDREGLPAILRVVQGNLRADDRLPDGANAPSCVQGFRILQRLDQ